MGNREKLLAGAKECLRDRGYARTTARDVAAASGANLASIGYHFGSMEALLTAAMIEGLGEWSASLERALAEGADDGRAVWARIVGSFTEGRPMIVASFEAFAQAERLPALRAQIAAAYEDAREGLAALLLGPGALAAPADARAVGSVGLALMTGLMAQWLADPDRAPGPEEIAAGLRLLAAGEDDARAGALTPPGAATP